MEVEAWLALALVALIVFGLILAPFLYAIGAALYWLIKGYRITPFFLAAYVLWLGAEYLESGGWTGGFILLAESWLGLGVAVSAAGALNVSRQPPGLCAEVDDQRAAAPRACASQASETAKWALGREPTRSYQARRC